MTEPNELDLLLIKLRQAQADGRPEEELAAIRKEITAAGNREAAARQHADIASGKVKPPAPRRRPSPFKRTPEISRLVKRLREAVRDSDFADDEAAIVAAVEPYVILETPREAEAAADGEGAILRRPPEPGKAADPERLALLEAKRAREAALPLGASRFGFVPDLPPELPWPRFRGTRLMFLAQIDLAAVPHWDGSPLPPDGWLYVFYKMNGLTNRPEDPFTACVLYHRGPREALVRAAVPETGADIWAEGRQEYVGDWRAGQTGWDAGACFMHGLLPLAARVGIGVNRGRLEETAPDVDPDEVDDLLDTVNGAGRDHAEPWRRAGHLLGQEYPLAGTPNENVEDSLKHGVDPVVDRIRAAPDGPGDDWTTLLFVRSLGSMMWSDAGFLYFLVRQADLHARDFSRVLMQCWSS